MYHCNEIIEGPGVNSVIVAKNCFFPPFDSFSNWLFLMVLLRHLVVLFNRPSRPKVSHNFSIGEWMYLTVCPLSGPGSNSVHGRVFHRIFPWLITLCQPFLMPLWQKMAQSPLRAPHNMWRSRRKAFVQPWTDNGLLEQWELVALTHNKDLDDRDLNSCGFSQWRAQCSPSEVSRYWHLCIPNL